LHAKLSDGSQQVSNVNPTAATSEMMSAPVDTVTSDYTVATNNLHGMAPYMMAISFFIGGIVMCFVYPVFDPASLKPRNGIDWWASKASVWLLVALAQAVIEVSLLMLLNGLRPVDVAKTYMVAIISSLAFMSLISLFNVILGKIGAFLMLIFMILQLSGSAGTYPIEVTNGFYMKIRPYLPMTYSIDALRQTISMGSAGPGINGDLFLLIMMMLVSTFLCIIFYSARLYMSERKGSQLAPEILSAQTLRE
jgi:putative membrane protein